MSYARSGQGVPHGAPTGPGWDQSHQHRDGQPLGQGQSPHQTKPLQSESERRYAARQAQQLPESFRTRPSPQYEEDLHDYPGASPTTWSPQSTQWTNRPAQPPAGHAGAPIDHQSPHRQFGDGNPASPGRPWPTRGDSAGNNNAHLNGTSGSPRERAQPQPQQQYVSSQSTPQQQQSLGPGPGGRVLAAPAYADYPGPSDPHREPTLEVHPPSSNQSNPLHEPGSTRAPGHWEEDGMLSPPSVNFDRPLTDSSLYSQSSLGSIPDFPVADGQQEYLPPPPLLSPERESPRQMPLRIPLGPPPSARRGPSSYYSQSSFVPPIREESGSRSSYASSNMKAIEAPNFYMEASPSDDDTADEQLDGRVSRAEDHDERSGLVRKESVGKKANLAVSSNVKDPDSQISNGGIVAQAVTSAGAAGGAFAAGLGSSNTVSRATTLQPSTRIPITYNDPADSDASSSTFDEKAHEAKLEKAGFRREAMATMDFFGGPIPAAPQNGSPGLPPGRPYSPKTSSPLSHKAPPAGATGTTQPVTPNDVRMAAIIAGLENGGAIDKQSTHGLKLPRAGFGEKAGLRRPPRINVDAVKEAEVRGSLTSLPDLIKRATRLASNLDRGKTASRLGLEWFSADTKAHTGLPEDYRKSGTLSDILASFPPPGVATPTGDRAQSRHTNATGWPQYTPESQNKRTRRAKEPRYGTDKSSTPVRKGRRCCGMRLCSFVLLAIVLLAIIVAAVVIPIALIVLPKQKDNDPTANSALSECQSKSPCQNGGSSTLAKDGSCSCLCANGYTGSSCTTASDSACTSIAIAGASNATIGSAIPRLLDSAQSNYSIPLDSARLLAQFSSGNVGCNTENALVTLNGRSRSMLRRSINNLFVPIPHESNPFVLSRSSIQPVPTGSTQERIQYFDGEVAGWDDGGLTYIPRPTHTATLERRASPTDEPFLETSLSSDGGQTVNGIIVATGSPGGDGAQSGPTSKPTGSILTASGSATATQSSPTESATSTSGGSSTNTNAQEDRDFARIAILFILQETGSLSAASDAQGRLSNWFAQHASSVDDAPSADAKDISLGASGWQIDLADLHVTTDNGTVYGSRP